MQTWFTADTHFQHTNIIRYCARPFADAQEMERVLVENWNAKVADEDTIYHCGDFAFGNPLGVPAILAKLKGHITLIRGNHDRKQVLRYFSSVAQYHLDLKLDGQQIRLCHEPYMHGATAGIVLCGHVHEKWIKQTPHPEVPWRNVPLYNVGVDVRGFAPVSLAEILGG